MTSSTHLLGAGAVLLLAVGAAAATPSVFETRVLADLNRFRADPSGYADVLATYRPRFQGKRMRGAEKGEIDIMTREGVAAVDEAIRDLRPRKAPLPKLAPSPLLAKVAADHVADQTRSGALGHYTDGRGPGERMLARGGGRDVNEVITYGHHGPGSVIQTLLIDDGVANRGHRIALLRERYRYAGVACGPHKSHRTMCVILMSPTADGHSPPAPARKAGAGGG